eukprot:SAG31_NODE_4517_length_3171_cov_4.097331_3_plen_76_part_00
MASRAAAQGRVAHEIDPARLVIGAALARGSFGVVHAGQYNGTAVAVKACEKTSGGAGTVPPPSAMAGRDCYFLDF